MLAGYALLGKGFAYVGYPPLLIGEVTMVLGLVVIFRSRCGLAMLTTLPSILLLALLALVIVRTATCFGQYGMDAIRDSVIVVYGLYAFIVVALTEPPFDISSCCDSGGGRPLGEVPENARGIDDMYLVQAPGLQLRCSGRRHRIARG